MRSFHASQASVSACAFVAASSLMRHEMRRWCHAADMGDTGNESAVKLVRERPCARLQSQSYCRSRAAKRLSATVLSLPASILGNEAALRFGRHRAVSVIMVVSALVALAIGAGTTWSPLIVLLLVVAYGFTVPADFGALTSGMSSKRGPTAQRGATMALHSTVGFGRLGFGRCAEYGRRDRSGGRSGQHDRAGSRPSRYLPQVSCLGLWRCGGRESLVEGSPSTSPAQASRTTHPSRRAARRRSRRTSTATRAQRDLNQD